MRSSYSSKSLQQTNLLQQPNWPISAGLIQWSRTVCSSSRNVFRIWRVLGHDTFVAWMRTGTWKGPGSAEGGGVRFGCARATGNGNSKLGYTGGPVGAASEGKFEPRFHRRLATPQVVRAIPSHVVLGIFSKKVSSGICFYDFSKNPFKRVGN